MLVLHGGFRKQHEAEIDFVFAFYYRTLHPEVCDKAVEEAYGVDFNNDEEKIVAHLFKLYAEITKD